MTPYHRNVVDLATLDRRASRPRRITGLVLACSSILILPVSGRALAGPPPADTEAAIEVAAPGPAEASEAPPDTAAPPMPADPAPPIPAPPPLTHPPQPGPENTGELPPATAPIQPSADVPPPAGAPPPSESKPNPPGTGYVIAGAVMLAPTAGLLVFGGLGKLWNANCDLICGDGSVSTGLLVAGGVIGVASVTMLITGIVMRDSHRAQLVVAPVTGPRMVGVGLAGQF